MEIEFKQYTGTKTIAAAPMTKADAEKLLGISISPATPGNDGYLVEYPDGYRSWSPAKVFEDAYRVDYEIEKVAETKIMDVYPAKLSSTHETGNADG